MGLLTIVDPCRGVEVNDHFDIRVSLVNPHIFASPVGRSLLGARNSNLIRFAIMIEDGLRWPVLDALGKKAMWFFTWQSRMVDFDTLNISTFSDTSGIAP